LQQFESISGWKDADEQAAVCTKKNEEQRAAQKQVKKKAKKFATIGVPCIVVVIAIVLLLTNVVLPKIKFDNSMNEAMKLIEEGDYDEGYNILRELGNTEAIQANMLERVQKAIDSGEYNTVYSILEKLKTSESGYSAIYQKANEELTAGNYEAAYVLLVDLDYNDSSEIVDNIIKQHKSEIDLKKVACAGGKYFFGRYDQDNNKSNGDEEIEWIILDKSEDKLLVVSKYALDCQVYNTSNTSVTWENCSLRKWLNETVLSQAFSSGEQAQIIQTTVSADQTGYGTDSGNSTSDKLFLLSAKEISTYRNVVSSWKCFVTENAQAQAVAASRSYVGKIEDTHSWWLRTAGKYQNFAMIVGSDGYDMPGANADNKMIFVRPAMWLSLK